MFDLKKIATILFCLSCNKSVENFNMHIYYESQNFENKKYPLISIFNFNKEYINFQTESLPNSAVAHLGKFFSETNFFDALFEVNKKILKNDTNIKELKWIHNNGSDYSCECQNPINHSGSGFFSIDYNFTPKNPKFYCGSEGCFSELDSKNVDNLPVHLLYKNSMNKAEDGDSIFIENCLLSYILDNKELIVEANQRRVPIFNYEDWKNEINQFFVYLALNRMQPSDHTNECPVISSEAIEMLINNIDLEDAIPLLHLDYESLKTLNFRLLVEGFNRGFLPEVKNNSEYSQQFSGRSHSLFPSRADNSLSDDSYLTILLDEKFDVKYMQILHCLLTTPAKIKAFIGIFGLFLCEPERNFLDKNGKFIYDSNSFEREYVYYEDVNRGCQIIVDLALFIKEKEELKLSTISGIFKRADELVKDKDCSYANDPYTLYDCEKASKYMMLPKLLKMELNQLNLVVVELDKGNIENMDQLYNIFQLGIIGRIKKNLDFFNKFAIAKMDPDYFMHIDRLQSEGGLNDIIESFDAKSSYRIDELEEAIDKKINFLDQNKKATKNLILNKINKNYTGGACQKDENKKYSNFSYNYGRGQDLRSPETCNYKTKHNSDNLSHIEFCDNSEKKPYYSDIKKINKEYVRDERLNAHSTSTRKLNKNSSSTRKKKLRIFPENYISSDKPLLKNNSRSLSLYNNKNLKTPSSCEKLNMQNVYGNSNNIGGVIDNFNNSRTLIKKNNYKKNVYNNYEVPKESRNYFSSERKNNTNITMNGKIGRRDRFSTEGSEQNDFMKSGLTTFMPLSNFDQKKTYHELLPLRTESQSHIKPIVENSLTQYPNNIRDISKISTVSRASHTDNDFNNSFYYNEIFNTINKVHEDKNPYGLQHNFSKKSPYEESYLNRNEFPRKNEPSLNNFDNLKCFTPERETREYLYSDYSNRDISGFSSNINLPSTIYNKNELELKYTGPIHPDKYIHNSSFLKEPFHSANYSNNQHSLKSELFSTIDKTYYNQFTNTAITLVENSPAVTIPSYIWNLLSHQSQQSLEFYTKSNPFMKLDTRISGIETIFSGNENTKNYIQEKNNLIEEIKNHYTYKF